MVQDRDYYKDLAINKFQLEQEWLENSTRSMYWGEQAAKATAEYNLINLERKIVKAQLGKQCRLELEESGKKPTDKVVEEMIRTNPKYEILTKKLIEAEEVMNIMDSAKWNFMARKTSLEKIHEGIVSGFFGDPRVTGEAPKIELNIRDTIAKRRS